MLASDPVSISHNQNHRRVATFAGRRVATFAGRRVAMFALLVGILSIPTLSQAVEYTAARKAGRGLAAMTTGFLEIPGNMVAESRKHGAGAGIPLGFVFGLGKLVVRELIGVYEFLSAPFEAPAGFKPIIEPEFPWDYFEDENSSSSGNRSN